MESVKLRLSKYLLNGRKMRLGNVDMIRFDYGFGLMSKEDEQRVIVCDADEFGRVGDVLCK